MQYGYNDTRYMGVIYEITKCEIYKDTDLFIDNSWHKFGFKINSNQTVSFFIDDELRWTSQCTVNISINRPILLWGRSNDKPHYVDNILVDTHINEPPEAPTITGPNCGKPNTEYEFSFNATDPDDDPVMYIIDWGDNDTEWTEYGDSGEEIPLKHTWNLEGTYTIKAKAKDINGEESGWSDLEVTMPKNKMMQSPFWKMLFERFPNMFPILRQLLRY